MLAEIRAGGHSGRLLRARRADPRPRQACGCFTRTPVPPSRPAEAPAPPTRRRPRPCGRDPPPGARRTATRSSPPPRRRRPPEVRRHCQSVVRMRKVAKARLRLAANRPTTTSPAAQATLDRDRLPRPPLAVSASAFVPSWRLVFGVLSLCARQFLTSLPARCVVAHETTTDRPRGRTSTVPPVLARRGPTAAGAPGLIGALSPSRTGSRLAD